MFHIVEKHLSIAFPPERHLHALVCQTPNHLLQRNDRYHLANPDLNWETFRSVLQLVLSGDGELNLLQFLFFPEAMLPHTRLDDALALLGKMRPNTVTVFGLGPLILAEYHDLLQRFDLDNQEALASVRGDLACGTREQTPVNSCLIAVKEQDGRLRIFLEAKSHPFAGEEHFDHDHSLYRGKIFPLFRSAQSCFNFMTLICLDYAYRDFYRSNINTVIEKANNLFFTSRQQLDLLAVIQCNPKPEHKAFQDVIHGYYADYLACNPGIHETTTLFCNSSEETVCEGAAPQSSFGRSAVIISQRHKIGRCARQEYATDDFGGLPVCRLRFGKPTRLYYFNLPRFHVIDPRMARLSMKVHSIFKPGSNGWTRLTREELES
jgi:hypothetical protein